MIRPLMLGAATAAAFGGLCASANASVVMNATRYVYLSHYGWSHVRTRWA